MKKIDMKGKHWGSDARSQSYAKLLRDKDIAKCLNSIIDYLENDFKEEIESIIEKKIENRFEILDL